MTSSKDANLSKGAIVAREVLRRKLDPRWNGGEKRWDFLESLSEEDVYKLLADTELFDVVEGIGPGFSLGPEKIIHSARDVLAPRDSARLAEVERKAESIKAFLATYEVGASKVFRYLDMIMAGADLDCALFTDALAGGK